MYFFYYVGKRFGGQGFNMMLNLTWGSLVLMLYQLQHCLKSTVSNIYLVSIVLLDAPVMFLREKKKSLPKITVYIACHSVLLVQTAF
jgi:hypothetical protein